MKRFLLFSAVIVCAAALANAQNDPELYIKKFFELVGKGKFTEAVESMPVNQKIEGDTAFTQKLLTRLEAFSKNSGEYCGYELVEKEEVSPSYVVYTYHIKYMNAPQQIAFTFYKPKDTWQVNNINFTGQARRSSPAFRKPPAK